MSSVTTTKDSQAQGLISKVPWTDDQGIAMKVYQGVMITLDILITYLKMCIAFWYGIYLFFVPPPPKSVKGEILLVTGAGHGMGREMALRFGRLGGVMVCVDINGKGNQETVNMIKEEKGIAHRYECDVTDRKAIAELAAKVRRDIGEVTILVNNAGIMPCKPVLEQSEKEIKATLDVNVVAHLWLIQEFLPSMMEKNHGHIVAMSSMAGMLGLRNLVPYCASKFAVRGLMEALHEELREDKRDFSGIKMTTICPFIVDTGLCKNPKIKYPSLMKIVTPQQAADIIVDAVRRNYFEITIPGSLNYVTHFCRLFPKEVAMHVKDFLDSGLDADL